MKFSRRLALIILQLLMVGAISCTSLTENVDGREGESWLLAPFEKQDDVNPIMGSEDETTFLCPVRNETVKWEAKDIFNPTALVRNGKIHLLYRAEDHEGSANGTSRIGLAISEDGIHFDREKEPIFYPENDDFLVYEWEGGCEDPRIVEDEDGAYVMMYTGYNGSLAILMVATTEDLRTWKKFGPVFRSTEFSDTWSKSGSVVSTLVDNRFVATKIEGKYWMYWGETDIFLATSTDLVDWAPVVDDSGELLSIFRPREGKFDSDIVEPGPQALIRDDGILLIYNSRNLGENGGDAGMAKGTYAAGQILFDLSDPTKVLQRSENYFFHPEKEYEQSGQVANVVFLEGLVCYKGKWFLYYGTADSHIAVATREDKYCSQEDSSTTAGSSPTTTGNSPTTTGRSSTTTENGAASVLVFHNVGIQQIFILFVCLLFTFNNC